MTRKPTKKQFQTTVDVLRILYAECKELKIRRYTPQLKKIIDLIEYIRPETKQ
jgi:hypothetical protein